MMQSDDSKKPRRSRKLRIFLFCLAAFALLIFFLPAILVNTPLKQTAINYALSDLNGSASVKSISAGWFSPIKLHGLVIKDPKGNEIISVDSVATTQTISGFIASSDYGTVEIRRPTIDLITRENGSNLEDAFARYMEPAEEVETSSTELPKIRLRITDGVARLGTKSFGSGHLLENINCTVHCMTEAAPLFVQLHCDATSSGQSDGKIAATILVDQEQTRLLANHVNAEVEAENFAAALLVPILTRIAGPTNCAGQIDGKFQLEADISKMAATFKVDSFHARQVAFLSPAFLGTDQFSAANLTANGSMEVSPTLITADKFKVETEFARIQADGEFDIEQLTQLASGQNIPKSGFQLDGILDLAHITSMLPETTRIRDGVKMNSGLLQIQASTRDENGSQRMVVNADTANFNMLVNDQNIVWQKPLRLVATAGRKNGSLLLENIQLQSEFINASGFAAIDSGHLKIDGDLQKVTNQLGQVLDLGGLKLAGNINGSLNWQTDANAVSAFTKTGEPLPIELNGRFNIKNPGFQYPGFQPWQENELDLVLAGTTLASTSGAMTVNTARADIKIGNETAVAVLNKPIADLMGTKKYQFNCQADGSIAKWLGHARNFAEIPEFFADGNLESQFIFTLTPRSCRLNQLRFQATDFSFNGFALDIREPSVNGKTNIKYDFNDYSVLLSKTSVSSQSVAATSEQLKLVIGEKLLADGQVSFRANANRASNWLGFSMPGDTVRWDGSAVGNMAFSSKSGMFGGQLNAEVNNLVFVQTTSAGPASSGVQTVSNQKRFSELWNEPKVQLMSQIYLSDDFNNLQLLNLKLISKLADLEGDGTLNDLAGKLIADWRGQWNVKWENINQIASELAGDVVTFEGSGWQPLQIQGPLYETTNSSVLTAAWIPPELAAAATVSWNQATVYKLPLGESRFDIQLNQSVAQMSSDSTAGMVGQLMQLKPFLDLRQAEPTLQMGQGKLLDRWQITVDDSRTWMKYAAPLIADATSAEGEATIELEGAMVPLFDPLKCSARGTMEIHELTIGAGPLARQLLPLIDQVRAILKPNSSSMKDKTTWLQLKPQRIPVVVQEGRVYHDNFEMSYKEFIIRTRGSVGFDQTMNLVADIPVLDEWVRDNQMLSRLSGKSISIPISGTLSKPQLDRRVVSQLTQQLIRDSAMGAVSDKISSEVNELQEKVGGKVQEELGVFQQKVNNKIKSEFENKLQDGLKGLFGGDK